jgi:hypothetical protein
MSVFCLLGEEKRKTKKREAAAIFFPRARGQICLAGYARIFMAIR